MNKTVLIIGGGVAGLSAGIYARQAGYKVALYEMNPSLGGQCTAWKRKGYHIDNCLRFLVGCDPAEPLYQVWKNTGIFPDDVHLFRDPCLCSVQINGRILHLWSDLNRARKELLKAAPEDRARLLHFFSSVEKMKRAKLPCEGSPADLGVLERLRASLADPAVTRIKREFSSITLGEYAHSFSSEAVRFLLKSYAQGGLPALTLVQDYALYASGSAAFPAGGSSMMISRMRNRLETLGGRIYTSSRIQTISCGHNEIRGIILADGKRIKADYYIWTADPYALFSEHIGTRYMDPAMKAVYEHPEKYPASTGFQVFFGIDTDEDLELPSGLFTFTCEAFPAAGQTCKTCRIRLLDSDTSLFSRKRRVLRCSIPESPSRYRYWEQLSRDQDAYHTEKYKIAREMLERIEKQFPALKDHLIILSTCSPITYNRWCNAHQGCYKGFRSLDGRGDHYIPNAVRRIHNLFLASQWLQSGGGLHSAVLQGKFAIEAIRQCEKDRR